MAAKILQHLVSSDFWQNISFLFSFKLYRDSLFLGAVTPIEDLFWRLSKLISYYSILGFLRTRILKVPIEFDFPEDSKSLEIRHVVDLPSDDTTYWCSVHKLPNEFKCVLITCFHESWMFYFIYFYKNKSEIDIL